MMKGLTTMILKLSVLGLVALSCFGKVNGLKCYECSELDSDLSNKTTDLPKKPCKEVIPKELTTDCPESKPFCFKGTGTVMNGKHVEFRYCADPSFKDAFGNNNCKPLIGEISFTVELDSKQLKLEGGEGCICDSDKCNPGTHVHPVYSFVIVGVISLFFAF